MIDRYSDPRQSGLAATDYQEWEVAIISDGGLVSIPGNPDYAGMPYRGALGRGGRCRVCCRVIRPRAGCPGNL